MSDMQELEALKLQLARLERNSTKTSWLLGQVWGKIKHFPRDFSRRLRKSIAKRRVQADTTNHAIKLAGAIVKSEIIEASEEGLKTINRLRKQDPSSAVILDEMNAFVTSPEIEDLCKKAMTLDPNIPHPADLGKGSLAPLHDRDFENYRRLRTLIPEGNYKNLVIVPFGKLGGADFVAGVLSRALEETGKVLILRTDQAGWDRPDWYADDVVTVDISESLSGVFDPQKALYTLIQHINPEKIYNVNSRACFDVFERYGERLSGQYELYSYYFCADRTVRGHETGYPVWYFPSQLPFLTAAFLDSASLGATLSERYAIPPELAHKLRTAYTPVMSTPAQDAAVVAQVSSRSNRDKPKLLWAGRFDRQKRFDLLVGIAKQLPDIEFHAWGKAVLDAPPALNNLPPNLVINPPFADYDELPLHESDGWLYTAEWDGIPTILIELAAQGVPIVASAVGGVPELIDETTGWPVDDINDVQSYVSAIQQMLGDDVDRADRAKALQVRACERHAMGPYKRSIGVQEG